MNFKLICIIALLLLILAPKSRYSPLSQKSEPIELKISPLSKAYFFGDKSALSKKVKKLHQTLNLQHLMTPSGLHLSSLLLIIGFFSKRSQVLFIALSILSFFVFPMTGFSSFKRMIIFGLLKNNPISRVSNTTCFWLTFALSFLIGMYSSSPLSFTLSFIFLGALIYSKFRLQTFLTLFFAQALISSWLNKEFYPLGGIYGLMLSIMSPFIFVSLIIENIFNSTFFSSCWISLLSFTQNFLGKSLNYPVFTLLPFYLMGKNRQLRSIALGLTICLTTIELNPNFNSKSFPAMPPKSYREKVNLKNGVKLIYANKMRCYSRLKMDEWSTHCY